MGKSLRRNWFIYLLVLVLACVSVYYIYDTGKGKLKGKSVNGEDVVYAIGDQNITASAFYEAMYKNGGTAALHRAVVQSVSEAAVKTTDEMKKKAQQQAQSVISNYAQQYPTNYREQLDAQLKQMGYENGYEDLENYFIDSQKQTQLSADYAKAHFDELKIRNVSYILIAKEQQSGGVPGKPSEAQQEKMDGVDADIAAGKSFAVVAATYSADTSTASKGGVLGTIDKNTSNLDSDFLNAALLLNEGEISDWVYSENFGFFKLYCNASTPETLEKVAKEQALDTANGVDYGKQDASATASPSATVDPETVEADPYADLISRWDTTLTNLAIWEKAESLHIDFASKEQRAALRSYMGLPEEEPAATEAPQTTAEAK